MYGPLRFFCVCVDSYLKEKYFTISLLWQTYTFWIKMVWWGILFSHLSCDRCRRKIEEKQKNIFIFELQMYNVHTCFFEKLSLIDYIYIGSFIWRTSCLYWDSSLGGILFYSIATTNIYVSMWYRRNVIELMNLFAKKTLTSVNQKFLSRDPLN